MEQIQSINDSELPLGSLSVADDDSKGIDNVNVVASGYSHGKKDRKLTKKSKVKKVEQTGGNLDLEGSEMCDGDGAEEGHRLLKNLSVRGNENTALENEIIDQDRNEIDVTKSDVLEEKKDQKKAKKHKKKKGTEMRDCDGAQEGVLKSSHVRADENILLEDETIDQDATVTVDTVCNLQQEKKEQKKLKKYKKKAVSVAANSEQNLETECENTPGNQSFEGTEMHEGAQKGCLLPKSSPLRTEDNKIIDKDMTENMITGGNLLEENQDQKKRKNRKNKRTQSVAVSPDESLQTEGEKLASPTQNNRIEQLIETQAVNVADHISPAAEVSVNDTETSDTCKKKKKKKRKCQLSSASKLELNANNGAKDPATESGPVNDTEIKQSTEENNVPPKVGTPTVAIPEKNLETDFENLASQTQNSRIEQTTGNQSLEGTEMRDGAQEGSLLSNGSSLRTEDSKIIDKDMSENLVTAGNLLEENRDQKKLKKPKRKRTPSVAVNPNQTLQIESEKVASQTPNNGIEQAIDNQTVEVTHHTTPSSEVAVNDTEIPDTCKKNRKKRKCRSTSVSQLELNDKDGAKDSNTESGPVKDTEIKQSTDENNVAPRDGIPIRASFASVEDACSSGEAAAVESRSPNRKLLILDINGLLADIVAPVPPGYKPDLMLSRKAVFKRPFCESFLQFCFEKFDVGVWSSRVKSNVDKVLDFLMGEMKNKLVFYWDRSHCTITRFPTIENRDKPLVLKELRKLWDDHPLHLGKYDQFNTLLLDDSPYKALCNPADTAIFPLSYQYTNINDCLLGPGGDLRVYLERLAIADNIPEYVRNNPFGQRPITETNLSWKYYKQVLDSRSSQRQIIIKQ